MQGSLLVDQNRNQLRGNRQMSYSKNGLRALCLGLLAALALMAFIAASAQAQTGWLLNKTFITGTKTVHAVIHPLADGKKHAVLDAELPALGLTEILCETLVTDDGLLFANEKAEGLVTLLYTNCKTFIKGVEKPSCKPEEPIKAGAKFHAILHTVSPIVGGKEGTHDNKTYLLFEPEETGKAFVIIHLGALCAGAEELPVTGEVVAECLNEKLEKNTSLTDYCLEDLVHHLIQEAPHKLFTLTGKLPKEEKWDELLVEGHLASLLGISDVLLSEESDKGLTWGVHI
jgi:hypothetical protein